MPKGNRRFSEAKEKLLLRSFFCGSGGRSSCFGGIFGSFYGLASGIFSGFNGLAGCILGGFYGLASSVLGCVNSGTCDSFGGVNGSSASSFGCVNSGVNFGFDFRSFNFRGLDLRGRSFLLTASGEAGGDNYCEED